MKVIFLGTPSFSVPSLTALIESKHNVLAIVTQTDKLSDRGKLIYSPVKTFALTNNIPLYQFENISNGGEEILKSMQADVLITVAYGQILKENILNLAKYGVINVHASLLPKYRGASPIQQAILNGDEYTGITIMKTAQKVDSGDIILQTKTKIDENENAEDLFKRLSILGGKTLIEGLNLIESGNAVYTPQNHNEATFCKQIKKSDGLINFNTEFNNLNRFIKGMTPWPSAYAKINDNLLKIYNISKSKLNYYDGKIGEIISADKNGLVVRIKDCFINLDYLQYSSNKKMTGKEFALGRKLVQGDILNG